MDDPLLARLTALYPTYRIEHPRYRSPRTHVIFYTDGDCGVAMTVTQHKDGYIVCSDKCRLKISSPAGGYKDQAAPSAWCSRSSMCSASHHWWLVA